jgi:hypothetical protein
LKSLGIDVSKTPIGRKSPLSLLFSSSKKPPERLRKVIITHYHKICENRLMKSCTPVDVLRIRNLIGPCLGAWITTTSTQLDFLGTEHVTRILAHNRLGLQIPGTPQKCGLCNKPTNLDPVHYLNCLYTRNRERRYIHEKIRILIEQFAHRAGGLSESEPSLSTGENNLNRADTVIRFTGPVDTIFVDVNTVCPMAISYRKKIDVLDEAALKKLNKHVDAANNRGGRLVPFVASTFGKLQADATTLLQLLQDKATRPSALNYHMQMALLVQYTTAVAQKWAMGRCLYRRMESRGVVVDGWCSR